MMQVYELLRVLQLVDYHVIKINGHPEQMSVIRALYDNRFVKLARVKARSRTMTIPDISVSYTISNPDDAMNIPDVTLALPNDAHYTYVELNIILEEEVKP
jgi:hypothetical protein